MARGKYVSDKEKEIISILYGDFNISASKISELLGRHFKTIHDYKYYQPKSIRSQSIPKKEKKERMINKELEECWEYWIKWYVGETIEESRYYSNIRFLDGLNRVILDRIKPDLQKYGFIGSARKIYDELRERASKLPRPPSILDNTQSY